MNIYYLGPPGSFSHCIAAQAFSESYMQLYPLASLLAIKNQVSAETDSVGVFPVENSITSNVHETIDYLFNTDLSIIGEGRLQIVLNLIGLKGAKLADIKEVYSHGKALEQCATFLAEHQISPVVVGSTSDGQQLILEKSQVHCAALGSRRLAEHPALIVLKDNIADVSNNMTRFLFVSQTTEALQDEPRNKMTVTFKVKHRSGSLAAVLTALAFQGANLTMISSRPIPGSEFEYNFWVDLEFRPEGISDISAVIASETLEHRIMGIYPRGGIYYDK